MKIFSLSILFFTSLVFGQTESRQVAVNVGVAHNFMRVVHKIPFRNYVNNFNFIPGGNIGLDFSLWSKLSVGISLAGQHNSLYIDGYQYTNASNNVVVEDVYMNAFIGGGQLRLLIHPTDLYDTDVLDFYFGVQQTSMFYFSNTTSSDPDFYEPIPFFRNIPCVVVGLRYYPSSVFGFYTEAAFPGPYTFSAGICFRNETEPLDWKFPFRFLNK